MLSYQQAVMEDERMQLAVLEKVRRWRRLTYGDVQAMLPLELRVRFREQIVHDLAARALLEVAPAGDELVLTLTEAGERYLAEHGV